MSQGINLYQNITLIKLIMATIKNKPNFGVSSSSLKLRLVAAYWERPRSRVQVFVLIAHARDNSRRMRVNMFRVFYHSRNAWLLPFRIVVSTELVRFPTFPPIPFLHRSLPCIVALGWSHSTWRILFGPLCHADRTT